MTSDNPKGDGGTASADEKGRGLGAGLREPRGLRNPGLWEDTGDSGRVREEGHPRPRFSPWMEHAVWDVAVSCPWGG